MRVCVCAKKHSHKQEASDTDLSGERAERLRSFAHRALVHVLSARHTATLRRAELHALALGSGERKPIADSTLGLSKKEDSNT